MMKRIIVHWTAGTYTPNVTDLEHYHYLITGKGQIVKGKYSVEDNEYCGDDVYAAHCGARKEIQHPDFSRHRDDPL